MQDKCLHRVGSHLQIKKHSLLAYNLINQQPTKKFTQQFLSSFSIGNVHIDGYLYHCQQNVWLNHKTDFTEIKHYLVYLSQSIIDLNFNEFSSFYRSQSVLNFKSTLNHELEFIPYESIFLLIIVLWLLKYINIY